METRSSEEELEVQLFDEIIELEKSGRRHCSRKKKKLKVFKNFPHLMFLLFWGKGESTVGLLHDQRFGFGTNGDKYECLSPEDTHGNKLFIIIYLFFGGKILINLIFS